MAANFTCHQCSKALARGLGSRITLARGGGRFAQSVIGRRHSSTNAQLLSQLRSRSNRTTAGPTVRTASLSSAATSEATAKQSTSSNAPSSEVKSRVLLKPDNLFHSFANSPSPEIRKRAAFIKANAWCPHPNHRQTRLPTSPEDHEIRKANGTEPPAHASFECPDCKIPVYCSEEHWMDDFEHHLELCETLKQINEDDHDLVSGRVHTEFDYPGPQENEIVVNMTNWDTFMFTREFNAVNDDRHMRQVTRLLTYPMTIASVVHDLSPYTYKSNGRLTWEGLKSMSSLRYTLHPPLKGEGKGVKGLRTKSPPVRIFVLGACAESSLPREVWAQLTHLFPRTLINIVFIGPDSMANRADEFPLPERTPENPFGAIVEDHLGEQMKITTYVDYFHTMYTANLFQPFDPYLDFFMLFHPGLGHPASSHEWAETLPQLLETKVPIIATGYNESDIKRDMAWVMDRSGGEVDVLLEPGENIFRSLRYEMNDLDPHDISCGNWGVWAFRGKRYEALHKNSE